MLLLGGLRRKRPGQRNRNMCCMLWTASGGRPIEQLLSSLQPRRQLGWRIRYRRRLRGELQRRTWDEEAQLQDLAQTREHPWTKKRFCEALSQNRRRRTGWFHQHSLQNHQNIPVGQRTQAFERPASPKGRPIRRQSLSINGTQKRSFGQKGNSPSRELVNSPSWARQI